MRLRIRRAGRADAAAIARLARELSIHQGEPVDKLTMERILRDGFGAAPEFAVALAERGDAASGDPSAAIGYALFYPCYESGHAARGLYLGDLFVQADCRRRGVGQGLIAAVAAEARRQGRTFVWWVSKDWNADAHATYRALGAVEEPVRAHAVFDRVFEDLADRGSDPGEDRPTEP